MPAGLRGPGWPVGEVTDPSSRRATMIHSSHGRLPLTASSMIPATTVAISFSSRIARAARASACRRSSTTRKVIRTLSGNNDS